MQEALTKSEYTHSLTFQPTHTTSRPKRTRRRNITWYNPPFSKSVASNVVFFLNPGGKNTQRSRNLQNFQQKQHKTQLQLLQKSKQHNQQPQ